MRTPQSEKADIHAIPIIRSRVSEFHEPCGYPGNFGLRIRRLEQMKRRPLFWVIPILLLAVAGAGAAVTVSPYARKAVINSVVTKKAIAAYNAVRPSLNFDNDEACLTALEARNIEFKPIADFSTEQGCVVRNAVKVSSVGGARLSIPAIMTCRMASLLLEFEADVLRPAANEIGTEVATINHVGTYNCRPMRNYNNLLSEHGFANGIDIKGFSFKDGRSVSLIQDWDGAGEFSRFLHHVGKGACDVFPLALTPNHNSLHRDHFHLDAGIWPMCGY